MTSEMYRSRLPVIPEKSASRLKATGMPIALSVPPRSNLESNSNRGIVSATLRTSRADSVDASNAASRDSSNASKLPSSGSSTTIDISRPS